MCIRDSPWTAWSETLPLPWCESSNPRCSTSLVAHLAYSPSLSKHLSLKQAHSQLNSAILCLLPLVVESGQQWLQRALPSSWKAENFPLLSVPSFTDSHCPFAVIIPARFPPLCFLSHLLLIWPLKGRSLLFSQASLFQLVLSISLPFHIQHTQHFLPRKH